MFYLLEMLLYTYHTIHWKHTHINQDPHTIPHFTSPYHTHHHSRTRIHTTITPRIITTHLHKPTTQSSHLIPHPHSEQIHSSGTSTTNIWRAGWHSSPTSGKEPTNQQPVFIPYTTTLHTFLYDVTTNNTTTKNKYCVAPPCTNHCILKKQQCETRWNKYKKLKCLLCSIIIPYSARRVNRICKCFLCVLWSGLVTSKSSKQMKSKSRQCVTWSINLWKVWPKFP